MPHHSHRPVRLTLLFHLCIFLYSNSAWFFAAETSPSLLLSDPKTATMITKILDIQLQDSSPDAAVVKKASKDDKLEGQLVEVKFPAKKPGKYNLQLICMSGELLSAHRVDARLVCEKEICRLTELCSVWLAEQSDAVQVLSAALLLLQEWREMAAVVHSLVSHSLHIL